MNPAERMKAGKPHTVYLAEQALDILTTLRTCIPSSSVVRPSRNDSAEPISQAMLNRSIAAAVGRINECRTPDQDCCRWTSDCELTPTDTKRALGYQPQAP